SQLAAVARVAFESVGVGEVTRDLENVEHKFRGSAGQMSDAAIRVQLAQERLQRTLRQGPGAYRQQASAELALRRAERELASETGSLNRQLGRHVGALNQTEHSLGRAGRGAIAGSGLFRGLGRSIAFASSTFLGGAG